MTEVTLRFGPIEATGFNVTRSGLRWLRQDGETCRAGEPIAYCSIGLVRRRDAGPLEGDYPFADEHRELQVAFAPRVGGRVRIEPTPWRGGFMDLQNQFDWRADQAFAHIDATAGEIDRAGAGVAEVSLLMLAGRRMTELAEVRAGLHAGWYERSRAWWGEGEAGAFGTVIGLGICDQAGILRGERGAFTELFEASAGPCQAILGQDEPLVPSAVILAEQLARTPQDADAIAEDMARGFLAMPGAPAPADWMFMGALASALRRRSLTESTTILTRRGLGQAGPADAVLMSLPAEGTQTLRHKRLGYALKLYSFRIREASPRVRAWLKANFEIERRTTQAIAAAYRALLDALPGHSKAQVLVMNCITAMQYEDIVTYAGLDLPLSASVGSIDAKEVNLVLHDLARERDVAIVDVDAIAAEMGTRWHAPDGLHQSGGMQAAVRAEVVRVLGERGVAGFGPRVS